MKQTIVRLTDDLDGSVADRTVEFALDGTAYTIDLSEANIGDLRTALNPYILAGERVGRAPRQSLYRPVARATSDRERNQRIRMWAVKNGHEIATRGRIPTDVVEAYDKAA